MSCCYGNDPEVRTVVIEVRGGAIVDVVVPKGVEVKVVDWDWEDVPEGVVSWWDEDGYFDSKAEINKKG